MRELWAGLKPWVVAAFAFVAFIYMCFWARDLRIREDARHRAVREWYDSRLATAECAQLAGAIAVAQRETLLAQSFLRQDLLVPRAILALEETRPQGIGVDDVEWHTDYLAQGPCVTLEVRGWAATPYEADASRVWGDWMRRLAVPERWEAGLAPLAGPSWSRRAKGEGPSLAFRARFSTRPTALPSGK